MQSYTPAARRYMAGLALFALLLLAYAWIFRPKPAVSDLIPFGFLTLAAALSHLWPVRSAREGAFYVVSNVFVFAAVVLLTQPLITLHCLLVMLPYSIWHRRKPRVWYRWAFNTAQTMVAAFAVRWLFLLSHRTAFDGPASMAVVLAAGVLFPVLQAFMVAVMLHLNNGVRLMAAPPLERDALLAEITLSLVGALVAAVWHAQPWFVALLPLPLAIMYSLMRQVQMVPLAEFDPKTGLYNYRHFEQAMSTEFVRAKAMRRPMALLFMDLDYMRHINNRFGHLAGDYVLKELAGILTRESRHGDTVARFGGEEFVALLPGTDRTEAVYIAERIRHGVEHHNYTYDGHSIRVTVSIGVVAYPVDGNEVTELMQRADEVLYQAKAEGRNRVKAAGDAPDRPAVPEERRPALSVLSGAEAAAAEEQVAAALADLATQVQAAAKPAPAGNTSADAVARAGAPTAPLPPSWLALAFPQIVAGGGGLLLLGSLLGSTWPYPYAARLGALAVAAIAAELLKVEAYQDHRQKISISMGVGVILAALALTDLPGAFLVGLVGGLMHSLLSRRLEWMKLAFNLGNILLSTTAAALVYDLFPVDRGLTTLAISHIVGPSIAALTFFAVNTSLVSVVIGLRARRNALSVWKDNLWFSPAFVLSGLTGAFLGATYHVIGPVGAAIFLTPILVLRYFFSLYARRMHRSIVELEDAKGRAETSNLEKEQTLEHLIHTISDIIDARDRSVAGHSEQVSRYAVALAEELALPAAEVSRIRIGAMLHDLGKIGIPEVILHKPSRLTPEEYAVVQTHAALGAQILNRVPALRDVARIVGEHHEYFNGRGYPAGKAGEEISIGGRIVGVSDTLDTILSDRPYSPAKPLDWALDELRRCAGTQFDPEIVAALLRLQARPENRDLFVNSAASLKQRGTALNDEAS